MMTNQQAKRGKTKLCPNGCGIEIFFESRFDEHGQLVTKQNSTDSKWFMMEDASKELHQCANKAKFVPGAPKPTGIGFAETYVAPKIDLSNFKPEFVTAGEEKVWVDIVSKVAEYCILAQKQLGEYQEITNPALKGLVTKSAFIVLNQINERKARK